MKKKKQAKKGRAFCSNPGDTKRGSSNRGEKRAHYPPQSDRAVPQKVSEWGIEKTSATTDGRTPERKGGGQRTIWRRIHPPLGSKKKRKKNVRGRFLPKKKTTTTRKGKDETHLQGKFNAQVFCEEAALRAGGGRSKLRHGRWGLSGREGGKKSQESQRAEVGEENHPPKGKRKRKVVNRSLGRYRRSEEKKKKRIKQKKRWELAPKEGLHRKGDEKQEKGKGQTPGGTSKKSKCDLL